MRVGISHGPGWFPVAVQALVVLAETDGPCSSSAMAQDLKAHAVYLRRILVSRRYYARRGLSGRHRGRPGRTHGWQRWRERAGSNRPG